MQAYAKLCQTSRKGGGEALPNPGLGEGCSTPYCFKITPLSPFDENLKITTV